MASASVKMLQTSIIMSMSQSDQCQQAEGSLWAAFAPVMRAVMPLQMSSGSAGQSSGTQVPVGQ